MIPIGVNVGVGKTALSAVLGEVRTAATHGIHSVWWAERDSLDALTVAALAGTANPGLTVGTAVVTTYPRHPLTLASQVMTVQAATGGRLILGLGPGRRQRIETVFGLDASGPVGHTKEFLAALLPLLRGQRVAMDGDTITARGQLGIPAIEPPVVLLAALGPKMLRLASELADGTITVWTGPRVVSERIAPTISGRIVVTIPVAVTNDPDSVRTDAATAFAAAQTVPGYRALFDHEGVTGPADVVVVGDETEVERQLRRYEEAGATEIAAVPWGPPDQITRTLELLGALSPSQRDGPRGGGT
jgi:F420-dependent oxidoreductase-like protein